MSETQGRGHNKESRVKVVCYVYVWQNLFLSEETHKVTLELTKGE